jgi:hypothetical protein
MDIEKWLAMDHDDDSWMEFQAWLRNLKREAGIHMENKKIIQPSMHRDHCATPEEVKRLVAGVDEFYFGQQPEQEDVLPEYILPADKRDSQKR